MLIIDAATNLWKNILGEPSNVSVPSICAYFRCDVGELNNLLGTCFQLNNIQGTNYLELVVGQNTGSLIDRGAIAVYSQMYLVRYYERLIRNFTGIGNVNILVQASSDEGTLRFVDRANLAKIYVQLRKDAEVVLIQMVNKYKQRHQTANQVTGDDIFTVGPTWGQGGSLYMQDVI